MRAGRPSALVRCRAGRIATGTYNLLTFSGTAGTGLSGLTFSGGTASETLYGDTYTLQGTSTAEELRVAAPPPVGFTWSGAASNVWSTAGALNWTNSSGASAAYTDNANVTFSNAGANTNPIGITATVFPNSVTFTNSTLAYSFTGTGGTAGIGGAATVSLDGGAGVTFLSANTYSGSTTIASGGTLTLGNGANAALDGSIANTLSVANSGTLLYNLAGSQTANYAINGTGNLIKAGSGLLNLTASSGYTGTTTVNGGTLTLNGAERRDRQHQRQRRRELGGGYLLLDNMTNSSNTARLGTASPIVLNGGTFTFLGSSGTGETAESFGALTIGSGVNTVAISRGNTATTSSATLVFGNATASLASNLINTGSGGFVNFTTAIVNTATNPPTLQGGPGGIYVSDGATHDDFGYVAQARATKSPSALPPMPLPAWPRLISRPRGSWSTATPSRWSHSNGIHETIANCAGTLTFRLRAGQGTANANVVISDYKPTTPTPYPGKTIQALMVQSGSANVSTLSGMLNIMNNGGGAGTPLDANGGILVSGSYAFTPNGGYTMNGGTITSGTAGTNSTLYVWIDSNTTRINSVIADIGGGTGAIPACPRAAAARWFWAANTYSGPTYVNQGTVELLAGGSLANTTIYVGCGGSTSATFMVKGNATIGTGTAKLVVNGAGPTTSQGTFGFDPLEASPSTLTLNGNMTVGGTAAGSPALLDFNLAPAPLTRSRSTATCRSIRAGGSSTSSSCPEVRSRRALQFDHVQQRVGSDQSDLQRRVKRHHVDCHGKGHSGGGRHQQ